MSALSADAVHVLTPPRRAVQTPARTDIWPPADRYGLARLELSSVRPPSDADMVGRLSDHLMGIADATWALQRSKVSAPMAERELAHAAARTLRLLGAELGGELEASLSQRADATETGDWDRNARLTAACDDHRLVALYGPLHTWSAKGSGFGFSAAVGVRDDEADSFIRGVENEIFAAVDAVGRDCGGKPFHLTHVPAYVVTDLIGCGGEANTFPKHFAYFMPEDGRVPDRDKTMTVLFRNVYVQQFHHVSAPVTAAVTDGWVDGDPVRVERALLTWLRGHDISHFLSEGGPVPDHLLGWPGFVRGTLQETFADVIGFLLSSTPRALAAAGLERRDIGGVFVAEMLRYFRRGWEWFPDSCAAQVELAYLVGEGFLEVDLQAGSAPRLRWDAASLYDGMLALGRELVRALLRGDEEAKARLRAHCFEPRAEWLQRFESDLLDVTSHVPDGLYYTFLP